MKFLRFPNHHEVSFFPTLRAKRNTAYLWVLLVWLFWCWFQGLQCFKQRVKRTPTSQQPHLSWKLRTIRDPASEVTRERRR
jgi:hypothetical protein